MLAKRWGICGNPHTGYSDSVYSRTVQLGWVRALVLDSGSWEAMLQQVPTYTNVAAVITGQSGPLANDFWSPNWREMYTGFITEFCERFYKKVRLIEFTNEWDSWDNEDKAEKAAELAILGTNICKRYGILGMLGSVAGSDWKGQLARAIKVIDTADAKLGYSTIHGFCFHPYMTHVRRDRGSDSFVVPGQGMQPNEGWERLSSKVRDAIAIAGGRACAVTEVGIKVGDAGGPDKQSLYVHGVFEDELSQLTPDELLMATYFCWTDNNGAPGERGDQAFGLISDGGSLRPAYFAATYQMQMAPTVDIPVERLLKASQAPEGPKKPDPDPVPTKQHLTAAEAHSVRWRAIVPTAVYNHDFGFERHWRQAENAWWGSPITESERTLDDGRPLRIFANAVVVYNGTDDTVEVM